MFIYAGPHRAPVDRELWLRAGMFGTIIVLVGLILYTPNLLGHPSELTSVPVLLVAMNHDKSSVVVDVTGAVQAYLYRSVLLTVSHVNTNGTNGTTWTSAHNDTYNAAIYVPANATPLWIHTKLVDQQYNYFEYNVSMHTFNDSANAYKLTMAFAFPDDPGTAVRNVVPPADFQWAVPRRGSMP